MIPPGMGSPLGGRNKLSPPSDAPARHQELLRRIAIGLVSARVRMRALLELLEKKGVLRPGEFDGRAQEIWTQDYQTLADELLSPPDSREEGSARPAPSPLSNPPDKKEPAGAALENLIGESVNARVRLRAVLELLEERGVLEPGEFEAQADAVWDRDYEELTLEFYKMNF